MHSVAPNGKRLVFLMEFMEVWMHCSHKLNMSSIKRWREGNTGKESKHMTHSLIVAILPELKTIYMSNEIYKVMLK